MCLTLEKCILLIISVACQGQLELLIQKKFYYILLIKMTKQKIYKELREIIKVLQTNPNQLTLTLEQKGPKCIFQKYFFATFNASIYLAKMKIKAGFQSILDDQVLITIKQKEMRLYSFVKDKLGVLNSSIQFLLKDGLLNLYINLNNLRQIAQKDNFTYMTQKILKFSLQALNKLLKQSFVYQQYRIRKKRYQKQNEFHHLLSQKSINMLQNMDTQKFLSLKSFEVELLREVEQFVESKPLAKLFQLEMKKQERRLEQIKEICRICSLQIKIKDIQKHVYTCAKKCQLQLLIEGKYVELASIEEKIKKKFIESCKDLVKSPIDEEFRSICKMILHFPKRKQRCTFRNSLIGLKAEKNFIQKIQVFILSFGQTYGENKLLEQWLALYREKTFVQKRLNRLQVSSYFSENDQNRTQSEINQQRENNFMRKVQKINKKDTFCSGNKEKSKFLNLKSNNSLKIPSQKHSSSSSHRQQSAQYKNTKQDDLFERAKSKKSLSKKLGQDSQEEIQCNVNTLTHYNSMPDLLNHSYNQQPKSSISLSSFQILKFLGQGAFGRVYMARRKKTKDVYALKIVKLPSNSQEKELESIRNEYEIFKKIGGEHLVKALFSFTEGSSQIFIMQYMPGGDLRKLLTDEVYFDQVIAKIYLAQIILAIQLLHQSGIIHRDLKPQNLVIDRKGHLKLTDFGLSQFQVNQKLLKSKKLQDLNNEAKSSRNRKRRAAYYGVNKQKMKLIGSPDYIAPQIINQTSFSNYTIDWWSLGVMAYQLMVGTRPFCGYTINEIIDNITNFNIEWPQIGYQEGMISPEAKDFISQLLNKNFMERLGFQGADELKKHSFLKGIDWQNLKSSTIAFLPKKMTTLFEMASIEEEASLRIEIQQFIGDKEKRPKKVKLQNFVRYDLLKSETIANMQKKREMSTKKLKKLKTLRQIAQEFQQTVQLNV